MDWSVAADLAQAALDAQGQGDTVVRDPSRFLTDGTGFLVPVEPDRETDIAVVVVDGQVRFLTLLEHPELLAWSPVEDAPESGDVLEIVLS